MHLPLKGSVHTLEDYGCSSAMPGVGYLRAGLLDCASLSRSHSGAQAMTFQAMIRNAAVDLLV